MTVVVVPGELQGSATEILHSILIRPFEIIAPVIRLVIAPIDLSDVEESLCPEVLHRQLPLAGLLAEVGKDCGQFASASLLEGVTSDVIIVAEGWELGHSFEEVIICVY